ncbi:iron-containing alcohol dehydrogenase [Moritella viscosa]|uniref:Possible iron-containing alcohol dehydrogenase n=1 Tax=Moritella viscosa TaxID=80854 RepID=A0A090ICX6_9GAMM|nr:iron-containing alcohol dehydrogenase [Moritella viscosa]CED59816.1 iron-containing alcohol dehydrogenase [Moritella viscosa]SGY87254.1 Possible iron-containing alcohol dehydrogenase [Moritella viscosa]SGY92849.1 Possible iron-containing alcohol dehydrogenase [Moritella viscosa]SGY93448.1 Possible iron-containing alcohol dehydrogenase [Moritella viscosa]SHO02647.1 Possible iron-containing alcohol dehydrogenase [Moritella viscosa]
MLHQTIIKIRGQVNKLIPIPLPKLIEGGGSVVQTGGALKELGGVKPLIVTDAMLVKLGIAKQLTDALDAANIDYVLFDEVTPDPTLQLIANGLQHYKQNGCDSVIALGGGSPMDCAKGIAAAAVKNVDAKKLVGLLRVRKALPPFIAIPTTAGTGSEATVVAVVTDPDKKQKFTIVDPCLVPAIAIIDPLLMLGLPAKITAETGIDALTHAIESYIGYHATEQTKAYGYDAVKRIFANLPKAYADGSDVEARRQMSIASFNAGVAFTRASIGYVHAIAHQMGGYYHIPHGLGNAVILAHVLEFSFENALCRYAELAIAAGLATSDDTQIEAAHKFVAGVKALNKTLNIQTNFPELKANDIPELAKRAVREAYCDYPVPKLMNRAQCENLLKKLLPV